MDVYFTPVLLTFVALVVQIRRNRQLDHLALAASAAIIGLVAGLRWYADVDYEMYVMMFDDNPLLSEFNQESIARLYGEPGYLLVTAVFKTLGSEFFLLALACALASVLLKAFVVSRFTPHASLAFALYLCMHFVTIEFIQMRWAVATGVIALGFYFQFRRMRWACVLAFLVSLAFHYYSVAFWVVALVVAMKGHRRFYVLFAASAVAALLLNGEVLAELLVTDSKIYVLQRLARYATLSDAPVGVFTYAKLSMYPAIYALCVWARPDYPWRDDETNVFLGKVSMASLSLTVLVTFIPALALRATVVADLFAIMWVINAIRVAWSPGVRSVAFAGLAALYCAWFLIDVRNYILANRVYEYQTWLPLFGFL